jgi:hypothetical protein
MRLGFCSCDGVVIICVLVKIENSAAIAVGSNVINDSTLKVGPLADW